MHLQVIVNRLNKRKLIPLSLPDHANIAGVVLAGFTFEGEEVNSTQIPNPALGKWYMDRDGYFYWGGGVMEIQPGFTTPPALVVFNKKDWGFIDFKIDELWNITKGKNIQVSILDTGLNFNLDDFKSWNNISYYNPILDSINKIDSLDNDQKGHGTDCCAILAAQGLSFYGIATEIHLNVIRITDANGQRTLPAFLKGMRKAIELKSDVISVSFDKSKTSDHDPEIESMHAVIKEAYDLDITIVASAGNSGELSFPVDNYPASFPECLSIGGIERSRKRSKFSTKSNFLDLMGPGEDLFSLSHPDTRIKGTSFSTPFVAGVIALLKSHAKSNGRKLTNNELFDLLKRSADRNVSGYNILDYGWGIIDPVKAMHLISIV